jgi:hypothetical protein
VPLTGNARMGHVEGTGQVRLGHPTTRVKDMSKRWPAHAKTRPKAYEIPTWAIANAIRKRPDKAKAAVRHVSEPPLAECEPEAKAPLSEARKEAEPAAGVDEGLQRSGW